MSRDNDSERLRRIRDKQIAARDPMVKVRKLDHSVAEKRHRLQESFSVGRMWADIPKMWRYTFLGGLVGVLLLAVLPLWLPGTWAFCGGLGAMGFLAILGFSLGRYEDSRDEIKHLVKH